MDQDASAAAATAAKAPSNLSMSSSHSREKVGVLLALDDNGSENVSVPPIEIYKGFNVVGRNDFPNEVKQISRKHISLLCSSDNALEIYVAGQNPVVVRSGVERVKISPQCKAMLQSGDVIELLPGKLPFKYVRVPLPIPSAEEFLKDSNASQSVEGSVDTDENIKVEESLRKRRRQIEEDEAFAMALQNLESDKSLDKVLKDETASSSDTVSKISTGQKRELLGDCNSLDPPASSGNIDSCSSSFRLVQVQGIPDWANARCVDIQELIQGNILVAILSNYMVDIDWLLSVCPHLKSIPRVVMIHGESGLALEHLQVAKPSNWLLYKPPLRLSYGTHHSKAMFLIFTTGVRVIVHTSNLIYVDWNNKTQGLWMQDFPFKGSTQIGTTSPFENDLVEYLQGLEWTGCMVDTPEAGKMKINAQYFRKFDYANASVRLVASIPGYHQGQHLTKWGHMKLRSILQDQVFEEQFRNSPLVYQFSSIGSLDEKWMGEFASSTCAGSMPNKELLGPGEVQIVWPTVEDVRWSLEGYAAGNAIPSPAKNVDKNFLSKYWAHWQAEHTGRRWFLLTSANLSKAAWGALQKNGSQLMIRSYELGVCFLPSLVKVPATPFSCVEKKRKSLVSKGSTIVNTHPFAQNVKLFSLKWHVKDDESHQTHVILPVPYMLPPPKYGPHDKPWSWDKHYYQADVFGKLWPRSVQLYSNLSLVKKTED
ncbi:hypothetical protein O6H91_04G125000 [Diphasiastrum complanatum]|uniref:Uncharacterized protein n=1 Tax=Diphasiastrum complanatum TaxID=34168 RepID=A0ACC2E1H9_DIPCM|nr:hypothetical protein O6H91_04G125000 [Diphasiastrum complanatum]